MDLYLAGKRAVVTGGSRGIGFAVAGALGPIGPRRQYARRASPAAAR
ncbi:hypothetical protein [Trebonia sp.]|nr:hypothetical protein [Trebonia sp.]